MTALEKKVDAIAAVLLANDFPERDAALADLGRLMDCSDNEAQAQGLDECIDRCLLELGVPDNLCGRRYLMSALTIAVKDPAAIDYITGYLYPAVAKEHETTPSRIERGIRHAIEVAWDRGDMDVLSEYFGNTVSIRKGKSTNSEFIARVANVIRKRMGGGVRSVFQ